MEVDDDASMAQNNASTASDDASKIIDVAADGDIIMIVGPDKRKFRVHSVMLKSASKVFKAMLSPNFAEGRRLRNNGHHGDITKIELPEDNDGGLLEMKRSTIRSEMLHKILAVCSCKDEGRILTTIRWGYSDDDKYDMAKCMSRGSLHTMWKYIKNAEPNLEFMSDFDPDSPKWWSWIEGIRKNGKMLLKDTRKPQAENVVGTQRP
ncbi:unnamed protein product [Colletotrichum noveboracense]|uniref:BTB domain-containing protein n=1 Tax=Colletotrichum noveboracense TaxID=2664923 RepID=A0A9W4S445_9PEZI|nr:unnamed protein product [Colletotrichum noveboracense]